MNASHCGLGSPPAIPVIDATWEKFRPAYERRLGVADFEPAFDLDAALAEARQAREAPPPVPRDDRAHLANQPVSRTCRS